MMLTVENLKVI